jgi:hypothetical protein
MAELRQSLHALVDRPPARPPGMEVVAARAARITRRQRLAHGGVVLLVAAVLSVTAIGFAGQDPEPDVMLATDGSKVAGYIAERPGGYVATGTWQLTITRGDTVIELNSDSSDGCGPTGIIQPGDEVRGAVAGRGSTLRVGEKFGCPR